MRLIAIRPLPLALLAACVACAVASGPPGSSAASSATTTVTATVLTQTTFSAASCPSGLGVTNFGSIQPGVTAITSSDCTFSFGSSNAPSSLRVYQ